MFTSTAPTPSATIPIHTHTHKLSIAAVHLFPSAAYILPTKLFSSTFSVFFYRIPPFMCIYKPTFGLTPGRLCLICLLKPLHYPILWFLPPLAKPTCILAAANGALYSCKLARGGKLGEKTAWREKTAAALTAVSMVRLLTWQSAPPPTLSNTHIHTLQTPFPPQPGFDMLKSRERRTESGEIGKDSPQTWHGACSEPMACILKRGVCVCVSLRQS